MQKRSFEHKISFDVAKEMLQNYLDSQYHEMAEEGFGGFFQDALFITPYSILDACRTIEDLNDFTLQYFNLNIYSWLNLPIIKNAVTIALVV